jgi:capsular polysaccharide biosynthesis protein
MQLGDYVRILVRRGWIALLLAVLAGGVAFVLSSQQQAMYRSTQTVLIQPSRFDLGLAEATNRLLESNVQYLDSTLRAQEIIERLSLDMTPQQLKGITTITANQNRLTVQIDVDLYSGELANDIAREWGNLLIQFRNEQNQTSRQEDRVNAILQDNPTYSLLRPRPPVNGIAGAVLGLLLGLGIVLVLEFVDNLVVRSRADIERHLDMPVLAAIPDQNT